MTDLLHPASSHSLAQHSLAQHYANIEASLNRRLTIAKAANDTRLIALLEQERQQIRYKPLFSQALQSLTSSFKHVWQSLIDAVWLSSELQVWQSVDDAGNYWWCAYDPQTGQSVYADSEAEMQLWINQH